MSPAVSAVVPCFETGALLLRAVESLRAQTLPPSEIIVVDDGSVGDDTIAALEEAARLPSVKVLGLERNAGVANARNTGLDAALGDYAVFLDADDMFTRKSLEAFVSALAAAGEPAGFAYPTVTCFGNRTDTFPPPPFNAYLLHHVNIVPIASMVTRRAIESGVRFDTSITIGHEDWDYWLRLVDAGILGCPAPDGALLYRRVGFTRMDLGNEVEGGFDRALREMRPRIFSGRRLATLKAQWAPAVSIISSHPERARSAAARQTCIDAEVIAPEKMSEARGSIIVVAPPDQDPSWLDDTWALDDILGLFAAPNPPQAVISVLGAACRPGTSAGRLLASDLRKGTVDLGDIACIATARTYAKLDGIDGEQLIGNLLDELPARAARSPHELAWRSVGAVATDPRPERATSNAPAPSGGSNRWSADVLASLPPAVSPRTAGLARGLFRGQQPSAFQATIMVEGPGGGPTLYLPHEWLPTGARVMGLGPILLKAAAYGATPLLRTIDHRTGRHGVGVEPLAHGVTPERVLGFLVDAPEDGTVALDTPDATEGKAHRLGWYWDDADRGAWGNHLLAPLINQRRIWRGGATHSGMHVYETSPARLRTAGVNVLGPVFALWTVRSAVPGTARAVYPLLQDRAIVGLTLARGDASMPPLGFLSEHGEAGMREVRASPGGAGSLLLSAFTPTDPVERNQTSLGFTTW